MLPEAKIMTNSAIHLQTFAIELRKCRFSPPWPWPIFSRSNIYNINFSQTIRSCANMLLWLLCRLIFTIERHKYRFWTNLQDFACSRGLVSLCVWVRLSVKIVRVGHTLAKIKTVKNETFVDFVLCHRMM